MKTGTESSLIDSISSFEFTDIFDLEKIQQLQDMFAETHDVASIITQPDGTPITNPSNFTRFCTNIIRKTEKGCANCFKSDALIGRPDSRGPIVQPCLSGGLWDAGASIMVGGKHLANWLIGQVQNDELNKQHMLEYADEIGADRDLFMEALNEVPVISMDKFRKIAKMLFAFANELSEKAFVNLQLKKQIEENNKTTKLLKESQENAKALLDGIPESVFLIETSGKVILANKTVAQRLGVGLDQLINQNVYNFLITEVANNRRKYVEQAISSHKPVLFVDERKGSIMENRIYPLPNENGEINRLAIIGIDISERIQAEKELELTKQSYLDIINTVSEAIYIMDETGTFIHVNKGAEKMYLMDNQDLIGKNPSDVSAPGLNDLAKIKSQMHSVFNSGITTNFEFWGIRKNGEIFPKEVIVSKGQYFGKDVLVATARDISERKQAEALFKNIIDKNPMSIQILDKEGFTIQTNSAHTKLFGAETPADYSIFKDPQLLKQGLGELFEQIKRGEVVYFPDSYFNVHDVDPSFPDVLSWIRAIGFALIDGYGVPDRIVFMHENITERKLAEEMFQAIIDKNPLSIQIVDKEGCTISGNSAYIQLFGTLPPPGFSIFNDLQLKSPELERLILLAKSGEVVHLPDLYYNPKDASPDFPDSPRWIRALIFPLNNSAGKPERYVFMHEDITERKHAEREMYKLRKALDRSTDAVFMTDKEGIFTFVNPGFTETYGFTSDEIIGKKTPRILKSGAYNNDVYNYFWEALLSGQEVKGELINKRKDGVIITAEGSVNAIIDENKEIIGFLSIQRDISERKKAEAKLQNSERFLKETQLIATLGSYTMDIASGKWESSEVLNTIFGITNDYNKSVEGWLTIIHQDWKKSMENYFADEVLGKKNIFDKEYMIVRQDDRAERWVHGKGSLKFNEKHEPVTMLGTIHDITDRKLAELELIAAKEKAEESDRLKSAFLANMSHEIRTPMNGILGFAELLKEPELSGEQQLEYIRVIEKSGARMLNIINDIVDISKIESGQMNVSLSESNVNEQLEYLFKFFQTETNHKGIQLLLNSNLSAKEAILFTDREKLYAILTNLIKNAIKYTPKGSIEIGCNIVETLHPTSLRFYVKDTGIGIQKNRQEAIFERFIQADINDKMARQGAGLGLAISKAYVEMLGGKIWVDSEPESGSTFYFSLPYRTNLIQEKMTGNEILPLAKDDQIKKLKVLIAEDDVPSGKLITISIQKFAKEIILVSTGLEAVEFCRKNPDVDLVLMDIQMPDMDGYEATRLIREFNPDVVMIAQTAYALSGDREKAMEAGCNDYLSKPIRREELTTLILKYLKA
jgi:PAS domain S-box-containing protein